MPDWTILLSLYRRTVDPDLPRERSLRQPARGGALFIPCGMMHPPEKPARRALEAIEVRVGD